MSAPPAADPIAPDPADPIPPDPIPPDATDPILLDPASRDLLFRAARTANAFADRPVTDAHLRAVQELARYGPTAFNAQPLRVVALRSPAARQRLLPHLSPGNRDKTAAAPLTVILAADTGFDEHLPRLFPHRPGVRDWFAGDDNAAARERTARFNATLQIGYLIVGARAAGLATGPMAGFDPAGVDAEFFRDGRLRALLLLNLGYPAAGEPAHPRPPRLSADDVLYDL
ncbi:nitroreductase family protein [Pilimelia anulata]|uniref:Nitroreductase family protein n=1 Tax=Pilimelia anulata TaxID=53371 RepID=A0A8J3FAY4_9ACTN|nr:malonic semialdehyde reductase [Pilimelia anulata]GGJ78806.1 nitroreductase family protein [Pilimelia anulata]